MKYNGDPKFRPLSPWAYFGYSILFSVPVVGLVFLIVFAFNGSNINRRNFARSYFCSLLIAAILIVTLFVLGLILGPAVAGKLSDVLRDVIDVLP